MSKFLKLVVLILLTTSFNSISFSNEDFFNEALKLFKNEKYEDARFLFERNIVYNPKDANSYLYLAYPSTPSGTYFDVSFCFD